MQYLRGNATASATALYVVCRYLSNFESGQEEAELRRSLQPLRSGQSSESDASAVLSASLSVGEELQILRKGATGTPWTVDAHFGESFKSGDSSWPSFRAELMRQIMAQAGELGEAPDLVLGMTWFLQLDPLQPLGSQWNAGAERAVRDANFEAVSNSSQWRAFMRWALALGIARRVDSGKAKVLVPDASTAIADQLPHLQSNAKSRDWLAELRGLLPICGAQGLLAQLPDTRAGWNDLPPAVALGLLKLEKAGKIALSPSDDASDVINLTFGAESRQVGKITVDRSNE